MADCLRPEWGRRCGGVMTPSSFDSLALAKSVQIDAQLRAYLIRTGRSVSAVSFDDVVSYSAGDRSQAASAVLGYRAGVGRHVGRIPTVPRPGRRGRPRRSTRDRPWFHPDASSMACRALIEARLKGLRGFDSSTATPRPASTRSRCLIPLAGSVGGGQPFPAPVLLATPHARHGIPLREQCIIRIQAVDDRYDLYRHPHYRLPSFTRVDAVDGSVRVVVEGGAVIEFPDEQSWNRWEQFALGRVFVPPRNSTDAPDVPPVRAAALEFVHG